MNIFGSIVRLDSKLEAQIEKEADKIFGPQSSYLKSLWIQRKYNSKGGQSKFNFSKPSKSIVKDVAIHLSLAQELHSEIGLDPKTLERYKKDILHLLEVYDLEEFDDLEDQLETEWSDDEATAAKEKKTLNRPFRLPSGSTKKFGVYVKKPDGTVVKVTFGDPNMEIKRDSPERRKSFRARHNCDNPGPRWKARYWSCRQWRSNSPVEGSEQDILNQYPELATCQEETED